MNNRFTKHFVLLIAMLLASVQSGLAATSYDYEEEIDGVTAYFTFNANDRTLNLVELSDKNIESFNVPAKASNGLKVSKVDLSRCSIKSITISEGITDIELRVCESLRNIVIPNSVTSIRFSYCTSLASIDIPNSVTTLSLESCTSLTSVDIPNSVTTLSLESCTSLTSVDISNSVTTLSLQSCTSLTSVDIPNSVKSLSLYSCTSLTSVDIPNSVTRLSLYSCTSLTSVDIPNSVTTLYLHSCTSLSNVVIPNSVTSIADKAFFGCTSLESIKIPNSVTKIGTSAFEGCTSLTSIEIPNSVTSIGDKAFSGCTSLQSLKILSDGEIGKNAFYNCDLKNVIVNSSKIFVDAFDNNKNLLSITFLNTIEIISCISTGTSKPYFLSGCRSIKNIIFYGYLRFEGICSGGQARPLMYTSIDKINLIIFVKKGEKEYYQNMPSYSCSTCSCKGETCLFIPSYYYIEEFDPEEDPFGNNDGIETIVSDDYDGVIDVYNMSGVKVLSTYNKDEIDNLPKGIYVVKAGQKPEKYIVK